ncbi:MAG: hypothetical protein ABF532_05615 [Bifidobacterium sp.]|uniref:hypothetical protein n=1 Tax=Bifidobacterium sp. TaxID=41200 RepID=UPI0039E7A6D0
MVAWEEAAMATSEETREARERTRASAKAQQERESEQHTGDEPTAGSGVDWNELHASTPYPNSTD